MHFDPSPLADGSHIVRVFEDGATEYSRLIVVTVVGDCLHLKGWTGEPLTAAQWRAGAKEHFKGAKRVRFERRKGDAVRFVELAL